MSVSEEVKNGICYMCMSSCPTRVHVREGKATKIDMVRKSSEVPCPRGRAQLDFVYHPDRLKYPLRRAGKHGSGIFTRTSWDEAMEVIASNLQAVKDKYGAESVAFWVAYTKEPRPYFHRLTHAFGSPNYCTETSSCASAAMLAHRVTYGRDMGMPSMGADVRCKLVWGTSVQNSMPSMWPSYLADLKAKRYQLIVVDPLRTRLAEMADIHLQPRPGTDGALALGMMNVIFSENLHDGEFIKQWIADFDELKKIVEAYSPERVAQITWVPAAKIREAAILYATRKPAQLNTGVNSATHHSNGVPSHRAIILLPAITGNVDVNGGGGHMPPGGNLSDITLHEAVKDMPPGIGSQRFPIWTELMGEMQSNALADQIDSGNPYPIKALFSAGLDVQFFANSKRMVESLKKLDFIAVTEYFPTDSTQLADIVLPVASWLERPILVTGFGGNIKLVEPAIAPVGESRSEWAIYSELAKRLGFGDKFWDGDFEQCVNYLLEPLGVTYEYLKRHPEGIKSPPPSRPDSDAAGAGFRTPSGKVEVFSSVLAEHGLEPLPVYQEPAESPVSRPDLAKTYPLVLTTGARVLAYTHSQFRNIRRLRRLMPEPLLDINPADAAARGIRPGDPVVISSPRGSIRMKANVTDAILAGVVSAPHHWPGEANVNLLIDDRTLDPVTGFPPFKSQLCQVEKAN